MGFSGSSDSKESACNMRDLGLILGSGKSPREGNDCPLQYSYLGNSMDRGAWQATVHGVVESDTTDWLLLLLVIITIWDSNVKKTCGGCRSSPGCLAGEGIAGGCWRPLELTVEKAGGQEWRLEGREESPNLTHMSKKRNTVIITHIIHQHRKFTGVGKVHFKTGQQPS